MNDQSGTMAGIYQQIGEVLALYGLDIVGAITIVAVLAQFGVETTSLIALLAVGLAALTAMLDGDPRVLKDPAPQVVVTELADSSVTLNLRCWANSGDFWDLKCDLNKWIMERLAQTGVSIPFPQRDVHLHQVDPAA